MTLPLRLDGTNHRLGRFPSGPKSHLWFAADLDDEMGHLPVDLRALDIRLSNGGERDVEKYSEPESAEQEALVGQNEKTLGILSGHDRRILPPDSPDIHSITSPAGSRSAISTLRASFSSSMFISEPAFPALTRWSLAFHWNPLLVIPAESPTDAYLHAPFGH